MSSSQQDTQDLHNFVAAAVDLSNAHFSRETNIVALTRSIRDWDNDCRQSYLYQIPLLNLNNTDTPCHAMAPPTLLDKSILLRLPSPSGKRTLIVKKPSAQDKQKSPLMELWEGASLVRRIAIKVHGPIINDPAGFGSPTWSPDETCLLYPAERFTPSTTAFWDTAEDTAEDKISGDAIRGGQNVLGQGRSEDWGEKYSQQSALIDLYILNIATGKMERVPNVPGDFYKASSLKGVTLGQPVWHPTKSQIAYTCWDAGELGEMPRRLGMVFCRNRASQIYLSSVGHLLGRVAQVGNPEAEKVDEQYACVTPDFRFSRSPQFVELQDNTIKLAFLTNPEGFMSHDGAMGLSTWDESNDEIQSVIPVIETPSKRRPTVQGMGFPGLFLSQLTSNCAIGKKYMVISTLWGSFQRIVRVDVQSGNISLVELPGASALSSHTLLCAANGDLIVAVMASNQPATVWHLDGESLLGPANQDGIVHPKGKIVSEFSCIAATNFSPVPPTFEVPIDLKVLSFNPPSIKGATNEPIQALLMLPKKASSDNKVPLIVIPHGGPHSCTASSYAPGFAYLASHYAIVFPNYRGSTGFGQASLECLLTRIGEVDVQDVMACADHTIEQYSDIIDSTRIGICGGSHGGFLAAHCSGQYPDYFRAAVMRNPVTNIATMTSATDIADWCHAECLGVYDFSQFRAPSEYQLMQMYQKSPIVHVNKVKTPTLVALGMVDLRVPPSQGKEWYHTLRSAGIDTSLLVYPDDCHSLDKVTTEADHWIHIKKWFDKYFS